MYRQGMLTCAMHTMGLETAGDDTANSRRCRRCCRGISTPTPLPTPTPNARCTLAVYADSSSNSTSSSSSSPSKDKEVSTMLVLGLV